MADEEGRPAEELKTTEGPTLPTEVPERIGAYRILQKVGEGGMGEVYEAEQVEPVRRRVALKVIKRGMETKQVVARFEAERQALALMDHPAVAKVFEAGETPRGRPYFVMEFVQGVPITEHCDRHRLSNEERLRLFLQVCDGVQHAHHKAIIHRDLKPSNLLVSIQDGKALPKIIDFGVAKATSQKLTEKTMFTELGVLVGTPEYMSPEQAEMTGQNVDTRTDVYSLGVVLYELMVGVLPFDSKELRKIGFERIVQKIREEDPPNLSNRLRSLGDVSTESARRRSVDLSTLRRQLRGDLDWVTMKAMEKDRTRRYGSPHELASDIERHLNHQPVLASPPSVSYRAGKFVRRHRFGVGVAAVAVLLLVGFAVVMAMQAGRIASERDRANAEAETARQVADFLVGLFEVADPTGTRGNSITARELLDEGSARMTRELASQPLVQARLMNTMGRVYRNLGLFDTSVELLEAAVETRRRELGDAHPDTAESMTQLGFVYLQLNRTHEARALLETAVATRESSLGVEHVDTGRSVYLLGMSHVLQGDVEDARTLLERALGIFEETLGPESTEASWCIQDIGVILVESGDPAAAQTYFERAVEIKNRALGPEHPDTAIAIGNVGWNLVLLGRLEEARPHIDRSIAITEQILGPDHPQLATCLHSLGELLRRTGEFEKADEALRRALAIREATFGPDSPPAAEAREALAAVHRETER
jgi:serine/threonine protein kinase/tetratricopeptide (TPR) repeat protein